MEALDLYRTTGFPPMAEDITLTAQLLAAAMRVCDRHGDGPAAREEMRADCLALPPHLVFRGLAPPCARRASVPISHHNLESQPMIHLSSKSVPNGDARAGK